MQFLLTQEEFNKLKDGVEAKQPEQSLLLEDVEVMLSKSNREIVKSAEFMGEDVLMIQVKLTDIPAPLKRVIERSIR